jgi:nicotinamide mononucleotide transporter
VTRVRAIEIFASVVAGIAVAAVLGFLLYSHTDASLPWVDSALLAASIVGSVWAARRNLESWWVWIVVDVLYVAVYVFKHLYLTAVLYAAFVVLAVLGLRRWQTALIRQVPA